MIASQAVLMVIGVDWEGRRQVLGVELANRESHSSWREFVAGLKQRGLAGVEFVVSDDQPGLRAAIREILPEGSPAALLRAHIDVAEVRTEQGKLHRSTRSPIFRMVPHSSAIGMNTASGPAPRSGWIPTEQRFETVDLVGQDRPSGNRRGGVPCARPRDGCRVRTGGDSSDSAMASRILASRFSLLAIQSGVSSPRRSAPCTASSSASAASAAFIHRSTSAASSGSPKVQLLAHQIAHKSALRAQAAPTFQPRPETAAADRSAKGETSCSCLKESRRYSAVYGLSSVLTKYVDRLLERFLI